MRLPSRLYLSRHGIFYFRVAIPERLRGHFGGRAELRKSLNTRDPREAQRISYAVSSLYLTAFHSLRMTKKKPLWNPPAVVQQEGEAPPLPPAPPEAQALFDEVIRRQHKVIDSLNAIDGVGKIVINLANGNSIACDTEEEFAAVHATLAGSGALPQFVPGPALRAAVSEAKTPVQTSGVAFTDVMNEAFADAAGGWTPRTLKSYKQKCADFAAFVRNPPIAAITREDITRYKRHLQENISPRSVNNYLGALSCVFEKAVVERLREDNPTASQSLAYDKDASARELFLPDQLRQIFDPVRMTALEDPAEYWFPLLAVFTGMRVATIGQLRVIDVYEKDGFPSIYVYKDKTPTGKREFPMARQLVALSFLEYVAEAKAAGCKRLFPHLNMTEQGFGKEISKRFSRLLEKLDAKEDRAFHSFRHTFNKRLTDQDVDEAVRCAYIGQKYSSVNVRIYKGQTPFHSLVSKVLPAIDFPEIEVAKLRVDQAKFRPLLREIGIRDEAAATARKAATPAQNSRGRSHSRATR